MVLGYFARNWARGGAGLWRPPEASLPRFLRAPSRSACAARNQLEIPAARLLEPGPPSCIGNSRISWSSLGRPQIRGDQRSRLGAQNTHGAVSKDFTESLVFEPTQVFTMRRESACLQHAKSSSALRFCAIIVLSCAAGLHLAMPVLTDRLSTGLLGRYESAHRADDRLAVMSFPGIGNLVRSQLSCT